MQLLIKAVLFVCILKLFFCDGVLSKTFFDQTQNEEQTTCMYLFASKLTQFFFCFYIYLFIAYKKKNKCLNIKKSFIPVKKLCRH